MMSEYIDIGICGSSSEKLLYKTVLKTVVDANPSMFIVVSCAMNSQGTCVLTCAVVFKCGETLLSP